MRGESERENTELDRMSHDWNDPQDVVRVNTGTNDTDDEYGGVEVPGWEEGKKALGVHALNEIFEAIAPYLVELIGTFFLTLTIGFNVVLNDPIAALPIGGVLMVLVFYGGHISGAHYNPAVTFGAKLTFRDHIGWRKSALYVVIQYIGSFLAALTYWGITNKTFTFRPGAGYDNWQALVVELIYTFLLVSVMINTATTKSQAGNSFFGLAIGFAVLVGAFTIGPISGATMNPAVATGATLVDFIHYNGSVDHIKHLWVYWVGPFAGAVLAALIFRITNAPEFKKRRLDDKEWRGKKKIIHGDKGSYYEPVDGGVSV